MTYPQSDPAVAARNGQTFWRLNTPLSSPGDVYESDSSFAALAIGPMSDVARVRATYFDDQVAIVKSNELVVSPQRAFTGRLDARMDQQYPLASGKRGRILLTVDDIFDPSYRPIGFNSAADSIELLTPRLDIVDYLSDPPTLIPARSDGDFLFNWYRNIVGAGAVWVVVPTYGRRQAFVNFRNSTAATATTWEVRGVSQTTRTPAAGSRAIETPIVASAVIAAGAVASARIDLANFGYFDQLAIQITAGGVGIYGPYSLRITTTDQA